MKNKEPIPDDEIDEATNKHKQQKVVDKLMKPFNDLELQWGTIDSSWGREGTKELYEKVAKSVSEARQVADEETGELYWVVDDKEPMWALLAYYTRDLRLGNLSVALGEYEECQIWLNLAGDLLSEGLYQPFMLCMKRVITIIELSQSKKGFLRMRLGTIRTESIKGEAPSKKGLLGGDREGGGM